MQVIQIWLFQKISRFFFLQSLDLQVHLPSLHYLLVLQFSFQVNMEDVPLVYLFIYQIQMLCHRTGFGRSLGQTLSDSHAQLHPCDQGSLHLDG